MVGVGAVGVSQQGVEDEAVERGEDTVSRILGTPVNSELTAPASGTVTAVAARPGATAAAGDLLVRLLPSSVGEEAASVDDGPDLVTGVSFSLRQGQVLGEMRLQMDPEAFHQHRLR